VQKFTDVVPSRLVKLCDEKKGKVILKCKMATVFSDMRDMILQGGLYFMTTTSMDLFVLEDGNEVLSSLLPIRNDEAAGDQTEFMNFTTSHWSTRALIVAPGNDHCLD
jgi:hypothetical protein